MVYKLVILDRDGVINKKALPSKRYITSWKEFKFFDGVKDAILNLTNAGFILVVITNQQGIAKNALNKDDLDEIHKNLLKEVSAIGGKIRKIYFCPHAIEDECPCRKPKPGMAIEALVDFNVNPHEAVIVGDSFSDYQTAKNVGCDFIHINTHSSEQEEQRELFYSLPVIPPTFKTLLGASNYLIGKCGN